MSFYSGWLETKTTIVMPEYKMLYLDWIKYLQLLIRLLFRFAKGCIRGNFEI